MLQSQRLSLELSQNRVRLSELAEIDDLTDEHRSEISDLAAKYRDLETRYQAAVIAETEDIKAREADPNWQDVRTRAMAEPTWVRAALAGTEVAGACAELSQELYGQTRSESGNVLVPWLETRAAGRTREQDVDPGHGNTRPIYGRVFDRMTATRALGLSPEMVPFGTVNYPYINEGAVTADVAASAAGTRPAAQRATLTSRAMEPRIASASIDLESLTSRHWGTQLESALIADLQANNADYMEGEAVDVIEGISDPATPSAATTFQNALSAPGALVDGIYAATVGEISFVTHPNIMAFLDGLYGANSREWSAWELISRKLRACVVSAKVSAPATNARQHGNILARVGMADGSFRWPVWDASELVINRANSGGLVVELTLNSYFAMALESNRRDSFKKVVIARA